MKRKPFLFLLFFLVSYCINYAQNTLPDFSVKYVGSNTVIIGWNNDNPQLSQISIQRSHDSLKNYKTILTVPDPRAIQNGFADKTAPNDHMYYRLFYVMEGGSFFFTKAQQPVIDSSGQYTVIEPIKRNIPNLGSFVPSFYVYTSPDGYVRINLPNADQRKFRIKFYGDDETFLFEIANIKESALTLDKTNFYHAGWFRFELYDDNELVEKHKFYLAKDF